MRLLVYGFMGRLQKKPRLTHKKKPLGSESSGNKEFAMKLDNEYEHLHTSKIDGKGIVKAKYKPIGRNPASDKSIQWDWIFFIVVVFVVIPWLLSK